jgi:Zn-dependent M28 family amino/carboxypeptidase
VKAHKIAVWALLSAACGGASTHGAVSSITAADLHRHISTLSSPSFEGRAPGTAGEALTVDYLQRQLRAAGLAPGNPDGTYLQSVPMTGVTSRSSIRIDGSPPLRERDDYVLWSYGPSADVAIEASELVFVGYGVVAPEYQWDDFKGVDLRGKTLVFLVGDPPLPDARMFRGTAMTYYGRWLYKFEQAAAQGAAAALIVHETGPAGYGFGVVTSNVGRERFEIGGTDGLRRHVGAEGWLSLDRAKALFASTGKDFDQLKALALRRDFRPTPVGARVTIEAHNTFRDVRSQNVVARVAGSDPRVRDEYVIYSAHWDHLGKAEDKVFAGALDNASGAAWLLEMAEAYAKLPRAPRRSVLFLSVTAEENGILGSKYYAEHPLYPLERTLANINMDVMNPWGKTRQIVSLGLGQTTMDEILSAEAAKQGRRVIADPEGEKGYYYRSDHFEFARHGVPALGFLYPGADYIGKPADYGRLKHDEYVKGIYHTPHDVVDPAWDLSGAVEDTQLLFRVGLRVAEGDTWPEWKPGTEFLARRKAMLGR